MNITISFKNNNTEKAADALMAWIVDGGGEDIISQALEDQEIIVADMKFDMKKRCVEFILDENE